MTGSFAGEGVAAARTIGEAERMARGARRILDGSDLRFGLITFGLVLGLCTLFAVSTPIGSSPDEHVQIVRAAGVVRGDPGGAMTETPSPGPGQPNHVDYLVTIPRSYAEVLDQPPCYAFKPDVTAECSPSIDDDDRPTQATTYVGSYPPPYYFVVGLPSLVLPAGSGVYVMRLVSALVFAALFALGFVAARRLGGGILVAAAAVIVTPMAVYLGGTVNPSGVEIAAAFATWLTALDLVRRRPEGSVLGAAPVWGFTAATATLAVIRPSGLLVIAVIAVTTLVAASSRHTVVALLRQRQVRLAAIIVTAVVALAAAWILYADAIGVFVGIPLPGISLADAARHILGDNLRIFTEMVGVFGWLDAPLPEPVWRLWGIAVALVVVVGFVAAGRQLRIGMLAAVGLGVIAPPLTQLRDVERYGYIWSGRYSLPFAMGVVVLAGWAIARRDRRYRSPAALEDVDAGGGGTRRAWRVGTGGGAVAIGVITALSLIASYVVVMQRFSTGIMSGRFDYLRHAEWQPPLNPIATTVALVIMAGAWGAWVALNGVLADRGRPDHTG